MKSVFALFFASFALSSVSMASPIGCFKAAKQSALNQAYAESDNQFKCKVTDAGILEPSTYWVETLCSNNASYSFEVVASETQSGCQVQQVTRSN